MGSSLSNREKLESVNIPKKGNDIGVELSKNNVDFYRALWWNDLVIEKDEVSLREFIKKYCPLVEIDDYKNLSDIMIKRSIDDYKNFFGV
tara:strand:- start:2379 stop:2648 length:270 start_codon:yes stop_codon:yes gene_type:complete